MVLLLFYVTLVRTINWFSWTVKNASDGNVRVIWSHSVVPMRKIITQLLKKVSNYGILQSAASIQRFRIRKCGYKNRDMKKKENQALQTFIKWCKHSAIMTARLAVLICLGFSEIQLQSQPIGYIYMCVCIFTTNCFGSYYHVFLCI